MIDVYSHSIPRMSRIHLNAASSKIHDWNKSFDEFRLQFHRVSLKSLDENSNLLCLRKPQPLNMIYIPLPIQHLDPIPIRRCSLDFLSTSFSRTALFHQPQSTYIRFSFTSNNIISIFITADQPLSPPTTTERLQYADDLSVKCDTCSIFLYPPTIYRDNVSPQIFTWIWNYSLLPTIEPVTSTHNTSLHYYLRNMNQTL